MSFEEYMRLYSHQLWSKVYPFLSMFNHPSESIFYPDSVGLPRRRYCTFTLTVKRSYWRRLRHFQTLSPLRKMRVARLRIATEFKLKYEKGVKKRKAKEESPEYQEYQRLKEQFEK